MKYFKVKPASDQVSASIRFKMHILVANELYTAKEIEKAKVNVFYLEKHFDLIEENPKNTFWIFGTRKQINPDSVNYIQPKQVKTETTKVKFYIDKDSEILAYFPTEVFDSKGNKACYAHIGQHSACSPGYVQSLKPASPDQYADLLQELKNIGYNDLEIITLLPNRF